MRAHHGDVQKPGPPRHSLLQYLLVVVRDDDVELSGWVVLPEGLRVVVLENPCNTKGRHAGRRAVRTVSDAEG